MSHCLMLHSLHVALFNAAIYLFHYFSMLLCSFHYTISMLPYVMLHYLMFHYFNVRLFQIVLVAVALIAVAIFNIALFDFALF